MIEIEVEMDVDVTYAEIDGIGKELEKLAEVEMLQEQMVYQAEAQDEVKTRNYLVYIPQGTSKRGACHSDCVC